MPTRSTHIGGSPIRFSLPGVQTQPLLPWRRILDMLPCMSISATVASRVICDGPACIARAILIARSSSSISAWAGPGGKASASLPKLPCTLSCPQARLPTRAAIAAPKKPRPAIALRRETDSGFALTEST